MSSRERKVRFVREFGEFAMRDAVVAMLYRHGADWLTDEQLAEIVSKQVDDWRFTQRMNRRNRLADVRSKERNHGSD